MVHLIVGGSGSGKSSYAETLAIGARSERHSCDSIIYLATMDPEGLESEKRIARHRKLREGKNFETVECTGKIDECVIPEGRIVLLEDIPNFLANMMFSAYGSRENIVKAVIDEIYKLSRTSSLLILVSDEVFSDGNWYDHDTELYRKNLGAINNALASVSDHLTEVVCGIPLKLK